MPRERLTFSPDQSRGARGLLDWTTAQCAARAGLELEALEIYESAEARLGEVELTRLGEAFYAAGVIAVRAAIAGEGVRFVSPRTPFATTVRPQSPFGGSDPFDLLSAGDRAAAVGRLASRLACALDLKARIWGLHGG